MASAERTNSGTVKTGRDASATRTIAVAAKAIFATRAPVVLEASAAANKPRRTGCIFSGNGVRAAESNASNAPSTPFRTNLGEFAQFFAQRALAKMCLL